MDAIRGRARHLRELYGLQKTWTTSELRRIELCINAEPQEIRDLEDSINRAVLYPAIAADAVIST